VKRFFRRFLSREMISPQGVAQELRRRGIERDQIKSEHLAHVYRRMRNLASAPDFTSVADLMPNRPPSGIDPDRPVVGVIVETRKHPLLEFVVSNFSRTLEIPIQIFHGKENREFIISTAISGLMEDGKVDLVQLQTDVVDARKYNAMLMTKGFWDLLGSRNKILVFQTDAIACGQSDFRLSDFMSFDYIGSKWPRERPVGLAIDGGSGGLSLRDWKRSRDCLVRFPPERWTGGEDGYFAFHIDLVGGKVGRDVDCAKFSTQHEFLYKSLGAHKITRLDDASRAAFLAYCKEAEILLR